MQVFTANSAVRDIERAVAAGEPFWLDVPSERFDANGPAARALKIDTTTIEHMRRRRGRAGAMVEAGLARITFAGAVRSPDRTVLLVETEVFAGGAGLITLRDTPCPPLDELRAGVQSGTRSADALRVLDVLTESLLAVEQEIEDEVDGVENRILEGAADDMLARTASQRRALSGLLRVTRSQRLLIATAGDELASVPGIHGDPERRVRDLDGHIALAADLAESIRDTIAEALNLSLSITSNRLGEAAERLSAVATVVLPLTVVTGFFGMNFAWMTDRIDSLASFLLLGIGAMVLSAAGARLFLHRAGYD